MKVLFLSDYYSTWNIGGATRVLHEQLKGLQRLSIECELISGYPGDPTKESNLKGWYKVPYKTLGYLPRLRSLIKSRLHSFNPDIIHIHQPLIAACTYGLIPKHCRVVYHFHSYWHEEKKIHAELGDEKGWFVGIKKWLELKTLKRFKNFITLSGYTRNRLLEKFPDAQTLLLPGSIDVEQWPEHKNIETNPFHFITVRRLEPRTGVEQLIEAFEQLLKEEKSIQLTIVGTGRSYEDLKASIHSKSLNSHIHLLGRVEQENLENLMSQAHCMAVPSQHIEGFGMVVIEAFACGLPVLCTNIGGLKEFNRHEDIILSTSPDPSSLQKGLQQALLKFKDTQTISQKARQIALEEYDTQRMALRLKSHYQDLLAS